MSGARYGHQSMSKLRHGPQPEPSTIGFANVGNGGDGYAVRMGARCGSKPEICGAPMVTHMVM